jgi:hypothetical protein
MVRRVKSVAVNGELDPSDRRAELCMLDRVDATCSRLGGACFSEFLYVIVWRVGIALSGPVSR